MMTLIMTFISFALFTLAILLFRSLLQEELGKPVKKQKKESESAIHFIRSI